jgi:TPR repeat protein
MIAIRRIRLFLPGCYKLVALCALLAISSASRRLEPRDLTQAYRWFNFAAQRGYPAAAASRDKLKPSLTPEQLQEAADPLPTPQSR